MRAKRVCIDPGHGGKDPGAIGPTGLEEKEVVLDVGHQLREILLDHGVEVLMTREADEYVSLQARAQRANDWDADCFLSIHCNSAKVPARGIETYCARRTKVSYPLAEAVQEAMTARLSDTPDRGVKRANFTVLTETRMAAALAELEFLHTADGEALLRTFYARRRYAVALAEGVLDWLGEQALPQRIDPPEPPACPAIDVLETVQRHATAITQTLADHLNRAGG